MNSVPSVSSQPFAAKSCDFSSASHDSPTTSPPASPNSNMSSHGAPPIPNCNERNSDSEVSDSEPHSARVLTPSPFSVNHDLNHQSTNSHSNRNKRKNFRPRCITDDNERGDMNPFAASNPEPDAKPMNMSTAALDNSSLSLANSIFLNELINNLHAANGASKPAPPPSDAIDLTSQEQLETTKQLAELIFLKNMKTLYPLFYDNALLQSSTNGHQSPPSRANSLSSSVTETESSANGAGLGSSINDIMLGEQYLKLMNQLDSAGTKVPPDSPLGEYCHYKRASPQTFRPHLVHQKSAQSSECARAKE